MIGSDDLKIVRTDYDAALREGAGSDRMIS